ncbi:hypothetical protein Lal_00013418 [Lupinus albus]|nr:hypothetical protein Lal_00013418 [Lupinus albus]
MKDNKLVCIMLKILKIIFQTKDKDLIVMNMLITFIVCLQRNVDFLLDKVMFIDMAKKSEEDSLDIYKREFVCHCVGVLKQQKVIELERQRKRKSSMCNCTVRLLIIILIIMYYWMIKKFDFFLLIMISQSTMKIKFCCCQKLVLP